MFAPALRSRHTAKEEVDQATSCASSSLEHQDLGMHLPHTSQEAEFAGKRRQRRLRSERIDARNARRVGCTLISTEQQAIVQIIEAGFYEQPSSKLDSFDHIGTTILRTSK
mmetsp:Transcript_21701/g.41422  ORF Transcript_21701/g.41422 Transcript_21701/m.41422 type:complete len:111 (+) Transcript_21701:523-855(+)